MDVQLLQTRIALFAAGAAIFFLLESLRPARRWHASRGRRLLVHGSLAAGNALLVSLLFALPRALLAAVAAERGWGLSRRMGLSGIGAFVAGIVVLDFLDYAWHRANHRVPMLWRFHAVHHTDTHVDVTTALRFHPGELLLAEIVKACWIVAWGPSLAVFATFEILTSLASQFHHGNLDLPPRAEPVLRLAAVTPRMHASHHSATTRSLDANFSVIFSCWDRLFGTYMDPAPSDLRLQGLWWGRDRDLDPRFLLAAPLRPVPPPADAPFAARPAR
jgi:sterol desaturase/sphingolipid hydroxylase (fatty acid hydroxylase superfamily)